MPWIRSAAIRFDGEFMGIPQGNPHQSINKEAQLLRTAPCSCMTELETGCSGSISCTRGSIPQISHMHPVRLFRRIFGEYSVSPRPPYNPFSYPICGVCLLTVKPLFHLCWWNDRQMNENHFPCGKVIAIHCSMMEHLTQKNAEAVDYPVIYYLYIT